MTYVLEASSLLRFLDQEAGVNKVAKMFAEAQTGTCEVVISAINWGEVLYTLGKRDRPAPLHKIEQDLACRYPLRVIAATSERAAQAAAIKLKYGIPFADCFAIQLASDSEDHILITADFDMLPAADHIRIEFLPPKLKPGSA